MGLKFPDVSKPETLERRYVGVLARSGINLMKQLLDMNPSKRPTALKALMHEYFDDIREDEIVE